MSNSALRIGAALVLVITVLGLADYFLKERPQQLALQEQNAEPHTPPAVPEPITESSSSEMASSEAQSSVSSESAPEVPVMQSSDSSSSRHVVKKGVSTKKKGSIDIPSTLAALQLMTIQTSDASLLTLITKGLNIQTMVLLQNNDRAALFSWIESDDTKTIFASIKQALQEQFSPKLTGLVDETQATENGPPVNILSFMDPAISPEKVIFLRVRNRLYEFHVAEKGTEAINALIAELSK